MIISKKGKYRSWPAFIVALAGFFLCHFLVAQNGKGDDFVLSKRVGLQLDSNEIEYFNLFPDFDFIRSAVYRKDNFGNVRFLLSSANGKDTTLTISRLASEELSKLIDHFEQVADSSKLVNWKLLPGFDQDKLNYFENTGRYITVYTPGGNFTGRLLMASDSSVCIWQKSGDFQAVSCDRFIKKISFSDIDALEVKPSFSTKLFGASIGAGLAVAAIQLGFNISNKEDYLLSGNSLFLLGIGGLAGAVGGFFFDGISSLGRYKEIEKNFDKYRITRSKIRSKAMFDMVYPPELEVYR